MCYYHASFLASEQSPVAERDARLEVVPFCSTRHDQVVLQQPISDIGGSLQSADPRRLPSQMVFRQLMNREAVLHLHVHLLECLLHPLDLRVFPLQLIEQLSEVVALNHRLQYQEQSLMHRRLQSVGLPT